MSDHFSIWSSVVSNSLLLQSKPPKFLPKLSITILCSLLLLWVHFSSVHVIVCFLDTMGSHGARYFLFLVSSASFIILHLLAVLVSRSSLMLPLLLSMNKNDCSWSFFFFFLRLILTREWIAMLKFGLNHSQKRALLGFCQLACTAGKF